MKNKILTLSILLTGFMTYAQEVIYSTSFEEPAVSLNRYFDTGDPNVAHDLINNADQPLVDHDMNGTIIGYDASYVPYDAPDVGMADGDYVGVTDITPSTEVAFTDGSKGYQMNDVDGNYILEFDPVDLTNISNASISLDFLLAINTNPAQGNYEGDGISNESGSDRLRIYVRDLTNNVEINMFDSTGFDLDDLVPFDSSLGEYKWEWQNATVNLQSDTTIQLVIEGRINSSAESFWFDNLLITGTEILGISSNTMNDFYVYPNPAVDFVNIEAQNYGSELMAIIMDASGKLISETSLSSHGSHRLDVSGLSQGLYLLTIYEANNGKISVTKKFIKK